MSSDQRYSGTMAWDADELTPSLFSHLVRMGNTFCVRQGIRDWPALEKWRHEDYLSSIVGDKEITAWHEDGSALAMSFANLNPSIFRSVKPKASEAPVAAWVHPAFVRRAENNLVGPWAALAQDIRFPEFLRQYGSLLVSFITGRDYASPCHYHAEEDNILCQVVGTKRVVCFPTTNLDLYHLDPRPWYSQTFNYSRIGFAWDGAWPACTRYPKLAETARVEIVLHPGDFLFIPIFCWHVAYSQGPSISVAMFWKSPWKKRYLTIRGFRSNYLNKRKINLSLAHMRSRLRI